MYRYDTRHFLMLQKSFWIRSLGVFWMKRGQHLWLQIMFHCPTMQLDDNPNWLVCILDHFGHVNWLVLFGPNLSQLFAGEKSGFRVSLSEKQEFLQCRGQAWFAYQQQRITEAGPGSNDLFWTCFFFPPKNLSRKKPVDWYWIILGSLGSPIGGIWWVSCLKFGLHFEVLQVEMPWLQVKV